MTQHPNIICDIYGFDCLFCGNQIFDLWDLGIPLEPGQIVHCRCSADYLIVGRAGHTLTLSPMDESLSPGAGGPR